MKEGRPLLALLRNTLACLPACALDPNASRWTSPRPGLTWRGVEKLGALGEASACPPPGLPGVGAAEVSSRSSGLPFWRGPEEGRAGGY